VGTGRRILLIGTDIGYSASPAMQNAALTALGLGHRYELADVPAEDLPGVVASLRADDHLGANVTTPHKLAVAGLVDELDAGAARVGAVNTVVRRDGRLVGLNTDLPALVDEVAALRPDARHALVLGGGGAGRAVILALEDTGASRVTRVSRGSWDEVPQLIHDADLLVNATPIGTGTDDTTPVPGELLHPDLAVLDLVYRPSPTRLVREARAAGAPARGGAGILLGQGWRSLEAWLGCPAPVEAMRRALSAELGEDADV
jgi:shikimate dehydrogenase